MITRLLKHRIHLYFFSNAGPKIVKGHAWADLPNIEFPTKPKPKTEEQLPMSIAYETFSTPPLIKTI